MGSVVPMVGVGMTLFGAAALFVLRRWRWMLAALGLQSLGVGLLASSIVALPIALVEVATGGLVAGILALTLRREGLGMVERSVIPPGLLFRALLALMISIAALALMSEVGGALSNPPALVTLGAVNLIAFGLLGLGLNDQPLRAGVALITVLQGFSLAYLWSERSLLVIALLAAIHLTVVLSVVYLHALARGRTDEDAQS